jgi:hypothetical protein
VAWGRGWAIAELTAMHNSKLAVKVATPSNPPPSPLSGKLRIMKKKQSRYILNIYKKETSATLGNKEYFVHSSMYTETTEFCA